MGELAIASKQIITTNTMVARAMTAAALALFAVFCVVLVVSTNEQDIVASSANKASEELSFVQATGARLTSKVKALVKKIGKATKAPRTQNIHELRSGKKRKVTKGRKHLKLTRLMNNLVDLYGLAAAAEDNIDDISEKDLGVLKEVFNLVLNTKKKKNLAKAWHKFVRKTSAEFPKGKGHGAHGTASLALHMLKNLDKKLNNDPKGIVSSRKGRVFIPGKTVGLTRTPPQWKKKLNAPYFQYEAFVKKTRKKLKMGPKTAGGGKWGQKEYDEMFKPTCMDINSDNDIHMKCHEHTSEAACAKNAGCRWDLGWNGSIVEPVADVESDLQTEDDQ